MTDKHNTLLSPYQSAILNELGISQWQLIEPPACQAVASGHPTEPHNEAIHAVSEPAVEPISIPEQVLLLMSAPEAGNPLVKDILLSLSLDQHEQVFASRDELKNYSDYPLGWILSDGTQRDNIQWQDNCLTTPPLDSMQKSEHKKQLWAILQKSHANTVL